MQRDLLNTLSTGLTLKRCYTTPMAGWHRSLSVRYEYLFMLKLILFIAISIVFFLTQALNAQPVTSSTVQSIDLLLPKNRKLLDKLSPATITTENDPLYHNNHSYAGYSLPGVLNAFGFSDTTELALRFVCKDGFKAVIIPSKVDMSRAYLVSKEVTEKAGFSMEAIDEGKVKQDLGPYALVWKGRFIAGTAESWPHGIVSIDVGAISSLLGRAYPVGHPKSLSGFELYRSKCMACHSVNMEGGVVGPELNIPRNVTEYWSKEHFFGFVANPQTYRFKSRMAIEPVPQGDIAAIYDYLRTMAGEKVCSSLKECVEWEQRQAGLADNKN
jgi:cytochrome c2